MGKKKKNQLLWKNAPPARRIALSFLGVILGGAILLMLPISNRDGQSLRFLDALFTATSATCVTGLTVITPVDQFNHFGQIVLIFLMQIGGIGLMTLVATGVLMLRSRLSLNDKIAMKEVLNQTNVMNFKYFIYGIIKYTLFFEIIGCIFLMFVMIPDYGIGEGIFKSIFLAVSAFCNAGYDVIGADSLVPYATNFIVNFTIMSLIVCGGLGFVVWFEVHDKFMDFLKRKISFRHFHHSLTLHTKLVIIGTLILILGPALIFFILEYNNPATLGDMSLWDKVLNSLFTSVTLRTAGFFTLPLAPMAMGSKFIMIICMFIGGSPGGTAGGIKTTTLMVIVFCVIRSLRGKKRTNVFNRHISRDIIVRSTTILAVNILALFTGVFLLTIFEDFSFIELLYEATSALATVGLTLGITPNLGVAGKLIIIMLMYVGRIGIITFITSIVRETGESEGMDYAEGHVIVG